MCMYFAEVEDDKSRGEEHSQLISAVFCLAKKKQLKGSILRRSLKQIAAFRRAY